MRSVLGLEAFVMLLPWFREDYQRHATQTARWRWFQWGYGRDHDGVADQWYILVALPSYVMHVDPFSYRGPDAEPTLHQRHLLYREPMPAGVGEWYEILLECPQ